MPRDGSDQYQVPGGTTATTLTPISSTAYNNFVADIAQDQNNPRPIVAGGTGATTAAGARTALGAAEADTAVTLTGTQTLTNKTLTTPTLTLKQSATPTPTAEGDIQWDTDDHVIAVGDSAATQLFVPIPASTAAGDIEYYSGAKVKSRLAKGTAGQALRMNSGATAPEWSSPLTAGTVQATTSGTSRDFTSIPSWVKRITVMFAAVSLSGNDNIIVQIGDAGGIEATGYTGSALIVVDGSTTDGANFTTGFGLFVQAAARSASGAMALTLIDPATNTWVASHSIGNGDDGVVFVGGGQKSLSATLDRVRITTLGGANTFDAGKVNILYE